MKRKGFTLIELLIAAALLGVVMTVLLMYFQGSSRNSARTNTWNDVQTQLQAVTQLIAQDLQQAGSDHYVVNNGTSRSWTRDAACGSNCTLTATPGGATGGPPATHDGFTASYVSSRRPQASACRTVSYAVGDPTAGQPGRPLTRNDRACGETGTVTELASNVLAIDIAYQCGGGSASYPDPSSCTTAGSYPRTATYTIVLVSDKELAGSAARTFSTVSGLNVSCPERRYCYGVSQQTLLPNLKDQ